MGGKYPSSLQNNCFLYTKDTILESKAPLDFNPIFENYLSQYVEDTQKDLNEYINFNQFVTIPWTHGIPAYIIEFVVQLVGNKQEVHNYFRRIHKSIKVFAQHDFEKQSKTDSKLVQGQIIQEYYQNDDKISVKSWNSTDSKEFPIEQTRAEARIMLFKKTINDSQRWQRMLESFKTLAVKREDSKYLSVYKVTE